MPHIHEQQAELRVLNASYSVGAKKTRRQILDNVSLSVRSGELLAIMGPSGAGKTTLLQLMTRQLNGGKDSGEMLLNGEPFSFESFRRHAVYVEQYDTHWGYLTCREIMHYAAQLSMSGRPGEQKKRAERVMERLGLTECADTRAGNEFVKGLSGGQRKRLALGVALLTGPILMFLDEPTSGLDAAAAASITGYLRKVARENNIAMVATIHQPSLDVFLSFDRVLFMANGKEAYQGPTSSVEAYCSSLGQPLPAMTNPADHFLKLVNSEFVGREAVDKIIGKAVPSMRAPQEGIRPLGKTLMYAQTVLSGPRHDSAQVVSKSTLSQTMFLLRRAALNSFRDPSLYLGRMVTFLVSNSFFAYIYQAARDPTQETADPRVHLLVWFVCAPSIFSVVAVQGSNAEFRLIRTEVINGLTKRVPYLIANSLCQIPYMFAMAFCSLALPWVMGAYPWDLFASAVCTMAAMLWTFDSMAQFFGTYFSNAIVGMLSMVGIWFCCYLFMGAFLSASFIAWPFRALVYALPLGWTLRGVVYAGISPTRFAGAELHADGSFSCPDAKGFQPCYGATGDQIMTSFSNVMSSLSAEDTFLSNIGLILACGAVFKIMFVIVLFYKTRLNFQAVSGSADNAEFSSDSSEEASRVATDSSRRTTCTM